MHGTLSALETNVPPPALLLLLAAGVWLLPQVPLAAPDLSWLGLFIVVLGLGINAWPKLLFRRASTTVSPLRPERSSALVTDGPYRLSRNPMYLGYAIALLGWAIFLSKPAGLVAVPVFVAYITRFQILPEERHLSVRFPAEYAAYLRAVRRWA